MPLPPYLVPGSIFQATAWGRGKDRGRLSGGVKDWSSRKELGIAKHCTREAGAAETETELECTISQ